MLPKRYLYFTKKTIVDRKDLPGEFWKFKNDFPECIVSEEAVKKVCTIPPEQFVAEGSAFWCNDGGTPIDPETREKIEEREKHTKKSMEITKEDALKLNKELAKTRKTEEEVKKRWDEEERKKEEEKKREQRAKESVETTSKKLTEKKKQKLLQDYNVWEEQFNRKGEPVKGKLITANLGDLIYHELGYRFFTVEDTEEIYYYNGGYYESKGEQVIRGLVDLLLDDKSTIHAKHETIERIRDKRYEKRNIFSPPLHFINIHNGVYNTETGELLPHSPDHYFLNEIPVNYKPDAKCPKILKFFSSVLKEEDIILIQEIFGYCFYRSYFIQKAAMMVGGGGNGKGTTFNILKAMLGVENISGVELAQLDQNTFAVADLYGKLANICGDLPKTRLYHTGKFKKSTGGDILRGEKKGKDPFYFVNYAKMLFAANQVPETADDTEAFFRRWIIIIFPYMFVDENEVDRIDNETVFRKDPKILEGLTTEEELEGLLLWSIEGLHRILKNGAFSYSRSTQEIQDYYERLSDPVTAFVKDEIEVNAHCYITKDALYDAYKDYAQRNNLDILPKQTFTKKLQQQPLRLEDYRHGKRGEHRERCWKGIRYTVDETINNYIGDYTPSTSDDKTQTSLGEKEGQKNEYPDDIDLSKHKMLLDRVEEVVGDDHLLPIDIARRMDKKTMEEIDAFCTLLKQAVNDDSFEIGLKIDEDDRYYVENDE